MSLAETRRARRQKASSSATIIQNKDERRPASDNAAEVIDEVLHAPVPPPRVALLHYDDQTSKKNQHAPKRAHMERNAVKENEPSVLRSPKGKDKRSSECDAAVTAYLAGSCCTFSDFFQKSQQESFQYWQETNYQSTF